MPLLRQSKLKTRPAIILKWDGVIVDPIGFLLAVFAFEIISFFTIAERDGIPLLIFFLTAGLAILLGWLFGRLIGWMFESGHIPEFLNSPAVFIVVIFVFSLPDELVHVPCVLSLP